MSNKYEKLATKIGTVVDIKQKAYGNSFGQAGAFLELLYPDGIPVKAYTDALCIVRIWDKLKRLSNLGDLPSNEGKLDAWQDIVGYGLLGLQKDSEPSAVVPAAGIEALKVISGQEGLKEELESSSMADTHSRWEALAAEANIAKEKAVVKHSGFVLDKSVLGNVLTQPIIPVVETEEETIARLTQKDGRYLALGAKDDDDGKFVFEKLLGKFKTELGQKEFREELMKDDAGNISYWRKHNLDQIEDKEANAFLNGEERQKQINLLAAGHAVATELLRSSSKEASSRKGVMELISAEELSDHRNRVVPPEILAKENLVLARLAVEEVKARSGFEDLMKDIAEADEPRRAQVRAFWDKLETERTVQEKAAQQIITGGTDEQVRKELVAVWTAADKAKQLEVQKEVEALLLREIEKAKLKHDAALPFVNEEHSTGCHYDATEVARKVANDLVDDGKCAVCELPVTGKHSLEGRGVHPGCLAEFYKDRQIVPEDLTLVDIGSGGPKCAICQCPFRGPLSKEVLDSFAPMVHEECYRKHFGDSPE